MRGLKSKIRYVSLALVMLTRLDCWPWSWRAVCLLAVPDPQHPTWFFHQSVVTMAAFAVVAIDVFWVSFGKQKMFKKSALG